jgi:O-antigen/teichoic acid export membrane protein
LTYGKELFSVWIRPDFAEQCAYLLPVLLIGEVIMAGQTNSVSILFGMGRHKTYSRWLLAESVLAAAGVAAVLPHWGLYGAVWVRSILMAVVRRAAVCWLVTRELSVSPLAAAFMGALYIPLTFRFSVAPHHREMAWARLRQLLG